MFGARAGPILAADWDSFKPIYMLTTAVTYPAYVKSAYTLFSGPACMPDICPDKNDLIAFYRDFVQTLIAQGGVYLI